MFKRPYKPPTNCTVKTNLQGLSAALEGVFDCASELLID
jgi:hypothetical protein